MLWSPPAPSHRHRDAARTNGWMRENSADHNPATITYGYIPTSTPLQEPLCDEGKKKRLNETFEFLLFSFEFLCM